MEPMPESTVHPLLREDNPGRWQIVVFGTSSKYSLWAEGEHLKTMDPVFVRHFGRVGKIVYYPNEGFGWDNDMNRYSTEQLNMLSKEAEQDLPDVQEEDLSDTQEETSDEVLDSAHVNKEVHCNSVIS